MQKKIIYSQSCFGFRDYCFPRDIHVLTAKGKQNRYTLQLLEAAIEANQKNANELILI